MFKPVLAGLTIGVSSAVIWLTIGAAIGLSEGWSMICALATAALLLATAYMASIRS